MHKFVDGCIRDYYYGLEALDEFSAERYAIVKRSASPPSSSACVSIRPTCWQSKRENNYCHDDAAWAVDP